jgi:hypothetical protein
MTRQDFRCGCKYIFHAIFAVIGFLTSLAFFIKQETTLAVLLYMVTLVGVYKVSSFFSDVIADFLSWIVYDVFSNVKLFTESKYKRKTSSLCSSIHADFYEKLRAVDLPPEKHAEITFLLADILAENEIKDKM